MSTKDPDSHRDLLLFSDGECYFYFPSERGEGLQMQGIFTPRNTLFLGDPDTKNRAGAFVILGETLKKDPDDRRDLLSYSDERGER